MLNKADRTLQVSWPIGHTIGLGVVVLILLLGALEGLARTKFVQSYLPKPNVSGHPWFDVKLARLTAMVEEQGSVDCIFLGASMVHNAVDPVVFAQAYRQQTGESIRCYNFGMGSLTASEAGILADLLIQQAHPRLLIYGTTARDYSEHFGDLAEHTIANLPWTQAALGHFSVAGWLSHNSYAYRYYLTLFTYLRTPGGWKERQRELERFTDYGFEPVPYSGEGLPQVDPGGLPEKFETLKEFEISEEDFEGLQQFVALKQDGYQIVLVEMPVPRTYWVLFGGEQNYRSRFLDKVGSYARETGTPWWEVNTLNLIPDDGWADLDHLNEKGALVFSEWLGTRVGEAVEQGVLSDPTP